MSITLADLRARRTRAQRAATARRIAALAAEARRVEARPEIRPLPTGTGIIPTRYSARGNR